MSGLYFSRMTGRRILSVRRELPSGPRRTSAIARPPPHRGPDTPHGVFDARRTFSFDPFGAAGRYGYDFFLGFQTLLVAFFTRKPAGIFDRGMLATERLAMEQIQPEITDWYGCFHFIAGLHANWQFAVLSA